jgi:hypothetical protein
MYFELIMPFFAKMFGAIIFKSITLALGKVWLGGVRSEMEMFVSIQPSLNL